MPISWSEALFWVMLTEMELRQLRYFVAVAEEGNISRAAKRIFLTQPALSRQIKALEQEVGQCLLERQAHSIRLTPFGEALLREGRELLRHADEALERVRSAGRGLRLRVGYAPSLAAGILSVAVANFTQAHQNAHVELSDMSTAEMLAGLENDKIDAALCVGQLERQSRGLKWTRLASVPWRLAVNRAHPLARKAKVTPRELAGERLLAYCQRGYPEYWEILTKWLEAQGQRPSILGDYDGAENLMAAVESGLGVALVTSQMARLFPNRVRLLGLTSAPAPVRIVVGQRSDRTVDKPLAVFVEELRKAAEFLG